MWRRGSLPQKTKMTMATMEKADEIGSGRPGRPSSRLNRRQPFVRRSVALSRVESIQVESSRVGLSQVGSS